MSAQSNKQVLVVGVGGLGCPAALALAQGGVGHLTLADPDRVELSNLHRQPWHRTSDLGRLKVESAAERLRSAFPGLEVSALPEAVTATNAEQLFRRHALVIDGTDNIAAKLLLSDTAVLTGTPLVYGGALKLEGQAMAIVPGGPCLRCLFDEAPEPGPTCAQAGVLGSVVGVVGAMQALIGLRILEGRPLAGTLLRFDARSLAQRELKVPRAANCQSCAVGAAA